MEHFRKMGTHQGPIGTHPGGQGGAEFCPSTGSVKLDDRYRTKIRDSPQRAHRGSTGGPGGHPQFSPKPENVGGNYFLGGFGGKPSHPNASQVPYNPFWSREIPYLQIWKPFPSKTMFFGTPDLLKTSPRPSPEPDFGFQAKCWILGPKFGPRDQQQKRCAPKKHAEPRLQN